MGLFAYYRSILLATATAAIKIQFFKEITMTQTSIQPIGDRILVQPMEENEQVKGGIIIPDSAKEKPQNAKVIALGTGKTDKDGKKVPFEVKVGDVVLISKYGGTEVKLDGEKFTLLREDDVLGIIK